MPSSSVSPSVAALKIFHADRVHSFHVRLRCDRYRSMAHRHAGVGICTGSGMPFGLELEIMTLTTLSTLAYLSGLCHSRWNDSGYHKSTSGP